MTEKDSTRETVTPDAAAERPATAAPEVEPPIPGPDLARRKFFRQFAGDLMHTAATVVGVAGALQRTSAEAANALLRGNADGSAGLTGLLGDAMGGAAGAGNQAGAATAGAVPGDKSDPPPGAAAGFRTAFRWDDDKLYLVDQRRLPNELVEMTCETGGEVAWAIREMVIRGAPAMGQAAAVGMALTATRMADASPFVRRAAIRGTGTALANARSTAVNVSWAVDRCLAAMEAVDSLNTDGRVIADAITDEAEAIIAEGAADHERLATLGLAELPVPDGRPLELLTHCNTGPLACGQFGTALGVVQAAVHAGREVHVWVDETRPYLQGARLTAWELTQAGVPHTLIADAAAGHVLATRTLDAVLVGGDRICANGDTANKIGTYPLAVLAQRHGVPFYVCAPISSIDLRTADGSAVMIEVRASDEVTSVRGTVIAPRSTPAHNPAFDITPAELITGIVTEEGVLRAPFGPALEAAVARREARAAAERPPTVAAQAASAPGAASATAGTTAAAEAQASLDVPA
ncbi:MAG TPA: S-methyl-5-thioribose-1-phosphate isomerase [Candidatus Acidoferrum sp.]|nr:S-methyl-5-thioribose-1-phosphate isomerase [Candidatus Acidoferrum sp.]